MKKMLSIAFMLCACIGLVGCDETKKDDDGQAVEYKKFVSKITYEFSSLVDDDNYTMSFTYDDKMRVSSVKMEEVSGTTHFKDGKYTYGTDQITFNGVETHTYDEVEPEPEQKYSKATVEKKTITNAVMTLSEGKIVAGTVETEDFENGESFGKDTEAWVLQYNGGYLNKKVATYRAADDSGVRTNTDECTWDGDNLVTVKNTGGSSTFTSTAEYDTKLINKEDCNIDANWLVYRDEFFDCVEDSGAGFDFLKFMGKPNKNLIVKTVDGYDKKVYTYKYEFTKDGYVSAVLLYNEGDEREVMKIIIEYRK